MATEPPYLIDKQIQHGIRDTEISAPYTTPKNTVLQADRFNFMNYIALLPHN
jgi:hypothetical protein